MEKYIVTGQDKELTRVLREQRIRVSRGVITITPISECGLITEEDAQKTLECMLAEKDAKIGELAESITEKDKSIVELTDERDTMKARIAELEALISSDNKNLPAADSKELPAGDTKEVIVEEDKAVSVGDNKKPGKGKSPK
nr:MAG TPA: V-type ATP synthase subunit I [Caudoviricetes sp.]